MEGGFLLDVIVGERASVLELFAGEDETLLVRRNSLLVLDLGLHVVDGVRRLHLQRDGLAGEGFHEDLHPSAKTKDKVEGRLLLDVVVGEGSAVFQLLAGEDETLLVRRNSLLVLDLGLHVVDGVRRLHLQRDGLAGEGFHEDLHPSAKTKDKVEGRLLLDVVVGEGSAVFQLLAGEDETLLVRRNSLLVLDLGLHVVDGVRRLHLQRDGLAGEGFHEDLHPSAKTKDKVEGRLLLDVVVGEGAAVFQLLAGEDETLLVRRNPLLVLDLGLHVVDGVRGLHFQSDGLPGQRFNEDLHPSAKTKHQVEGGFLLNIIVGEGSAVLELLAGEDQTLLVWRNPLLVLDLGFHVVDGVRGLHLQRDGLASEGFHEDLHPSAKTEDKVEGGLLLDVIVGEGATVFELFAGEDQTLLVRRNSLLVLDLGLHVVDGVRGLHLQRDGLAGEGFHEDLHPSAKTENEVEGGLFLDVVVGEGAAVLELFASEDETLLVRRNPLLVLNLGLDVVDGVRGLHLQRDGLAGEGFHEDLHL